MSFGISMNSKGCLCEDSISQLQRQSQAQQQQQQQSPAAQQLSESIVRIQLAQSSNYEMDISAFMLGNIGKVVGEPWFVFYGNTNSPDGSVVYGDEMQIDLDKISEVVRRIVVVITIDGAVPTGLAGAVRVVQGSRILKETSLSEANGYRAISICDLQRIGDNWSVNPVFNRANNGLAQFCKQYGVEVE